MSKIYLKPVGGLCNRIRAIDSLLSIAADSNKRLVVVWEKNNSLNCAYNDLFQPTNQFDLIETQQPFGGVFRYFPSTRPGGFLKRTLFGITKLKIGADSTTFFDDLSNKLEPLRPTTPDKYRNVSEFDSHTFDVFSPIVSELKQRTNPFLSTCWRMIDGPTYGENFQPATEIADEVARLTEPFTDSTYGIHIRGTDAVTAKQYSSLQAFEDQMQQIVDDDSNASFFLATDEPTVKEKLIGRYGSKIFFFDQPDYARDSPENIKNAFVDLLCLSKTQEVFGSYFSTFSQLAAQWNGIKETTIFRDGIAVTP
jgi:hypothetical protein